VADGAIDVTSTVIGKVSELGEGEASLKLRVMAPEAHANRASFGTPIADAESPAVAAESQSALTKTKPGAKKTGGQPEV
jgi:hypothetical protein